VPRLRPVSDVSPAAWLGETVREHGVAHSQVPTGLDAYVQILHPAEAGGGRNGEIPGRVLDLLAPVLGRHTRSVHGWFCLWEGWGFLHGAVTKLVAWPVDNPPAPGTPTRFRSQPALAPEVRAGPKVRLPSRDYYLFEGPLEAVGELGAFVSWEPGGKRSFERQTPSLWWPDDHAWCAGNEIDGSFTCVGGSRALIDELLQQPDLEVLELDPDLA
jgi:hypothetical protein